jgi:MFS family permease
MVGYVKSFSTIAALMAISVLIPIISSNIILWSICRFIQGFCIASLFVIIESWVLSSYPDNIRGKALSHYMIVLYGSYAIGQLFFLNPTIDSSFLFCFTAILINASIIPLSSFPVTPPMVEEQGKISLKHAIRASAAGFLGCVVSGMLISTIIGILPVYAQEISHNSTNVAFAMFSVFIAGVLTQYPISYLADKFDRQKLQISLNLVFTLVLIIFMYLQYTNKIGVFLLPVVTAIVGIFSFSIYPLSTHLICENLKKSEIIKGIELVMISYGVGSIIGPLYIAYSMRIFGPMGFYIAYATLTGLLFISTIILHKTKKKRDIVSVPAEEITTPLIPFNSLDLKTIEKTENE